MKKIVFLLIAVLAINARSQATIRRVNNTPGVNSVYASISTAVSASAAGDTIHVEGSTTGYGSVYITKRVVLIGPGFFLTDTAANPNTQANKLSAYLEPNFGPGAKGSVVQGLMLGGVTLSDSFITIQRNVIYSNLTLASTGNSYGDTLRQNFFSSGTAVYHTGSVYEAKGMFWYNNIIERNTTGPFLQVNTLANCTGYFVNNTLLAPSVNEISFFCTNFTFQNNIFPRVIFGNSGVLQPANIFVNNIAKSGIPSGNNNVLNIDINDVFLGWNSPGTSTYSTDARYKLKAGSPALNAGILNGVAVDCGAFGGPAPYVLSGMPPIPSVYQFTMPNQVNSGTPSINVTIGAASH